MDRRDLLFMLGANEFAAFEIQLYLDAHADDAEAVALFNEYHKAYENLRDQYESLYGPITSKSAANGGWQWISDPWPWERSAN